MSLNTVSYIIEKEVNKVIYSKDIDKSLIRDISFLKSDQRILFIYDKNISKKFINKLKTQLKLTGNIVFFKEIEGKKTNKKLPNLLNLFNLLIKNKFTKNSVIISCGGGVVGDMCGLLSSLYLRGTIYFHIPTTMTAIVDSCIGGKTGINYKRIINSIGTYYHPKSVFISKNIINLIPNREFYSGFSEIIKSGCLDNNRIFRMLKNNKNKLISRDFVYMSKLISLTLNTKIKFFKNDIYENSKRLNLNFGHTFAHAIEMALKSNGQDIIRHGEAVGIGMLCEIFYSEGKSKKFFFIKDLLKKYKLPINIKKYLNYKKNDITKHRIYKNIFLDKKRINNFPRCIKITKFGSPEIIEMRDNNRIFQTIEKVIF